MITLIFDYAFHLPVFHLPETFNTIISLSIFLCPYVSGISCKKNINEFLKKSTFTICLLNGMFISFTGFIIV